MSTPIVIVEHLDPERLVPSGIDTIISDMIRFSPDRVVKVVGITTSGHRLGNWTVARVGDQQIQFLPVARFDRRARKKLVPHSLRFALGLLRFRKAIAVGARGADVHTHRIETGLTVACLRIARPVQFIHNAAKNLTGSSSESIWRLISPLYRALESQIIRSARALVVFNAGEARRLSEHAPGKCIAAQTWYDPGVFYPPKQTSERTGVAWVGRLEAQKNPLLLADVAQALSEAGRDLTLEVVGEGSLRATLEHRLETLGVSEIVNLRGALPRDQVSDVLRRAAAFLMTSHFEGSPTALVEALACGTPAATTLESDQDNLLENRAWGRRIRGMDASEIAHAILELLDAHIASADVAEAVEDRSATSAVAALLRMIESRAC